jgi:hypothetical protein
MPGGEARTAQGCAGGGSDPKRRRLPAGLQPGQRTSVGSERPRLRVAGPLCSLVCLRIRQQGGHLGTAVALQAAGLHAAMLRGDRPTCEDLTAGWLQKETS